MDSLIGKTIDSYRIVEVIGRGGMGVVFKALDTNLEKIVALKMIDPFLARDENFVRRFKTEAKALAKLENPNIVGIYALRETDSGFFMVMEYVDSKPLSQCLNENGSFSIKDTVSIAKQLLNAIGHAHKVGVIHRDIKPSNILLSDNGRIKVTDFGLAKVVQAKGPASTITQARAGTLYYMSPEQVKGLKNVDIRSDLYSLGMTVYEMIAGRVPFDKTDSDFTIQKKIVDGEIPSPVKFNAIIPKRLAKIIYKSIDKDPDKRYQSADEMFKDLENYENELLEEKKKIKTPVKARIKRERVLPKFDLKIDFKKPAVLISSAAVFIILVLIFFILFSGDSNEMFLSIATTPPGAEIIINSKAVGQSPVEAFQIEEEDVNLQINKAGFVSVDTTINLKPGENEGLAFILNPIPMVVIKIATNPVGAKLYINSNSAGSSPLENYSINQGLHDIRIEKTGYLSVDTVLKVSKDLASAFNFNLRKDSDFKGFGTLKINSTPAGASVLFNGEFAGKTPYYNKELPVGDYQLTIRESGYSDYTESIKIVVNKTKTITKKLAVVTTPAGNFGKIRITTKPSEAAVYLNGEFVGSTPYENEKISAKTYNLSIKKKGYGDYNSSIRVDLDKLTTVAADLAVAAKLTVNSDPAGADVLINDKAEGKTPYTNSQMAVGEYTITVTKSGFKPYTEKIKIADGKSTPKINQKLEPRTGKVEILVRPYGSIYIDNDLKAQDTNSPYSMELPGGKHRLKLEHPTLGSISTDIMITGEKTQKYIYDLTRVLKLTIVSNPSYCEIFVDGENTGKYTPYQLKLRAGSYRIMVKKDGYNQSEEIKYDVPSSIYQASGDSENKQEFVLTKTQ